MSKADYQTSDERLAQAREKFQEIWGDAPAKIMDARLSDWNWNYYKMIQGTVGECFSGEGLDQKTRGLVTTAIIAALNSPNEVAFHAWGALQNGATPEELSETVKHVAVYAGLPAGAEAQRVIEKVVSGGYDEMFEMLTEPVGS